jgi:transcription elongation factor GreA
MSGSSVKFGATVTIVDEDTDEEKTIQIVGEHESNSDTGKISLTAPIARALIGKSEGESIEVQTPKGKAFYEILNVAFK